MRPLMIGTSAFPTADTDLLKQAGMGWVRQGLGYPFVDRLGGELSPQYLKNREAVRRFTKAGIQVMGITPGPGGGTYVAQPDGSLKLQWRNRFPAWYGELGSEEFLRNYEATCEWLAEDLRGLVPVWQLANELDITQFAGPLNPRQACDLVAAAARGLKHSDPSLIVGHNPAGAPPSLYFFGYLHGRQDCLLDYCGIDGYYGTWGAGGPENWAQRVAELYALTSKPVLINEWGYSSAGGIQTEEEARTNQPVCKLRKWRYGWGEGHTPDGQAKFVAAAFEALKTQRGALLGVFFYRWEDQETCWQCGSPDCPAETAWGLVDKQGQPKPAFYAWRDGARSLT
ncbi:hypothetical protein LLH03_01310 [bacterium]|nr:hypothetical protein [bacterium]